MTAEVGGRRISGRDLVALVALTALIAAVIASAAWLEIRAKAAADAKARANAEAAVAAQPRPAPPITTSVFVRSIPVRHAQ